MLLVLVGGDTIASCSIRRMIVIYIYITNIVQMKITFLSFPKNAHQFTDVLASPEMSVRVDFEG